MVNLDTNETYRINFKLSKEMQIYEIPAGKYKINSFHGMTDFIQDNYEVNLKTNPTLLNEFEINQGCILYIGDYLAKKPYYSCPTAKILRFANFEKSKKVLEGEKCPRELAISSLDFVEVDIDYYKYNYTQGTPITSNKCYLAGRFILEKPSWSITSFKLFIDNVWEKKRTPYTIGQNAEIQYIEVDPGEYLLNLEAIRSQTLYLGKSLPDYLKIPFIINPGEVIYVGKIQIVETHKFSGVTVIVGYQMDLEENRRTIMEHFVNEDLLIKSIDRD